MPSPDDQRQRIQDHYEDPFHRGRCERGTHLAEAENTACDAGAGDVVVVELKIDTDTVMEAWFDGEGCELSQATASMLIEKVQAKPVTEIAKLDLGAVLQLLDLDIPPSQRPCCQVSLSALQQAIDSPFDNDHPGPTFSGPDLGDEC